MSEAELATILKKMYAEAGTSGKATAVHRFGLLYASEITACGRGAARRIMERADIGWNDGSEINKMLRLAPFVAVKDHAAWRRRFEVEN